MKQGKLSEHTLENAILKNRKKVSHHRDFSQVGEYLQADGYATEPVAAWHKALGNFACSLGECVGARVQLLMSETTREKDIREWMGVLDRLAGELSIPVLGGNTGIITGPENHVTVTLFGKMNENLTKSVKVKSGNEIVMVGTTGVLGTNELLQSQRKVLEEAYGSRFLEESLFDETEFTGTKLYGNRSNPSLRKALLIHDISAGGVYGALWQLGEMTGKGLYVENSRLPIRQNTIEICECLNQNPYCIDGTGGFLVVTEDGKQLENELRTLGMQAVRIGMLTEEKARRVSLGEKDIRTLAPL